MSYLNTLLFGVFPYIALAVAILGSWIRFDTNQYTWKASSSQLLRKDIRLASNLFHVGIIFILAGHFVGLLTPHFIYSIFITSESKQLLAMVSGGFFGLICLAGLWMLIQRRTKDPRIIANSSKMDTALLWILLAQLVLGLLTIVASTQHLDGSVMISLADWAQSIVTFRAGNAAESISGAGLIYKLHVLLGLCLVFIFPFTRLVHVISFPIWFLGRNQQIVRQKRAG